MKVAGPKESQIQTALVQVICLTIRPGVIFWHTPNQGARGDARYAKKLQAMGVRPGVSDLIFLWQDSFWHELRVLFLELKAHKGRQSDTQKAFEKTVTAAGAFYELADSLDSAIDVLNRHGLLKGASHDGKPITL